MLKVIRHKTVSHGSLSCTHQVAPVSLICHPQWHLDRFILFAGLNRHTQTLERTTSVAVCPISAMHAISIWKSYSSSVLIVITIIITTTVFMVLSSCPKSSPGSSDESRLNAGWPPTLRPSLSTWAVIPPKIGSYHPHPPSPLLLLLSPSADTHFTIPRMVEG